MRDLDAFVRTSRDMMEAGASIEEVLARLRRDGCEAIESIKVLTEVASMDLAAAKRAVHLSEAWSDRFEAHEAFHDKVEDAAGEDATGEHPS